MKDGIRRFTIQLDHGETAEYDSFDHVVHLEMKVQDIPDTLITSVTDAYDEDLPQTGLDETEIALLKDQAFAEIGRMITVSALAKRLK